MAASISSGPPVFGGQRGEQLLGRLLLGGAQVGGQPAEPGQQHVQVAHRAEGTAQPAQLGAQAIRPFGVQQRAGGLQRGSHPAHRDAQLVHVLDVGAGACAGVVLQQRAQPGVQGDPDVVHRRVLGVA